MIREGIRGHIRERNLKLAAISKETGIDEDKLERFCKGEEVLNIEELESVANTIEFKLTDVPQGYVSQAGSNNINIQIVSFGDEGGVLIDALSEFVKQVGKK